MGRGKDFRGPRRRGFDDDMPPAQYDRGSSRPSRPPSGGGMSEPMRAQGPATDATVKWFNPDKGFGFAELADGSGDAFLHIAALQAAGHDSVAAGAKLKVEVGRGAKGAQIVRVLEVDQSTATAQPPRSGPRPGARPPRFTPDPSTAVEITGAVKWFNPDKGFGFVTAEDGGKDVFVHVKVLAPSGATHLADGQRVTMRVVDTPKGREAVSITLVE